MNPFSAQPQEQVKPFSYRELSDLHREFSSQAPETFGSLSLSDFSKELNREAGQPIATAGVNDNWLKRLSTNIDRGIEYTGLQDITGAAGRGIGEVFGMPEAGERVGRGFPRGVVNFAPLMAAEMFTGGGATPFLLGSAGTSLLSAGETLAATDNPLASTISGTAASLVPAAFKFGGQQALRLSQAPVWNEALQQTAQTLGKTFLPELGQRFAQTTGQKVAEFAGGNLGAIFEGEIANQISSLAQGQGLVNPFTPEHVFETTLGAAPWAALGIPALRKNSAAQFVDNFMKTSETLRAAEVAAEKARVAAGVATQAEYGRQTFEKATPLPNVTADPILGPQLYSTPNGDIVTLLETTTSPRGRKMAEVKSPTSGSKPYVVELADLTEQQGPNITNRPKQFGPERPSEPAPLLMNMPGNEWAARVAAQAKEMGLPDDLPPLPPVAPAEPKLAALNESPSEGAKPETSSKVEAVKNRPVESAASFADEVSANKHADELRKDVDYYPTYFDSEVFVEKNADTGRFEVGIRKKTKPALVEPLPDPALAVVQAKDVSLPERAGTPAVQEHLIETITLRKTLAEKFGMDFPEMSDAQIDYAIKDFAKRNPNHPDPSQGWVEGLRAETVRKAQEENELRHAGKTIGTDEGTVEQAMELLNKAPKGEVDPATGKAKPGDADTVARVVGEFGSEQSLGVSEAIYRAYRTFVEKRQAKGETWSQEELASSLGKAGRTAKMKGESKLSETQLSYDKENDGGASSSDKFSKEFNDQNPQHDPGTKAEYQEQQRLQTELHEDNSVAGQDVAAISDDIHLITTLAKLTELQKSMPEIWSKIWQRKGAEGNLRTRLYINLAFDKLQSRGGKISPVELNQVFQQYDAVHGTKLAYERTVPKDMFKKLQQTFEYIAALPDYGVEGAMGNRSFMLSSDLRNSSRGTERAGLITTQEFYRRLFREKLGYSKQIADAYSEIMVRTIAAFGKNLSKLRVTGLEGGDLGAYVKSFGNPLWTGIVGIAEQNYGKLQNNMVMHQVVFGHELTHATENQYTLMRDTGAQLMPKEMFDSFQRLDDISQQLTRDQRLQLMGEFRDMLLPKFKDKKLDGILEMSSNSPEEFRATLGSLIAMNHVGDGVKSSRSMRDILLNAPKEVSDFVKGMVRYVADMARAMWASLRGDDILRLQLGIDKPGKQLLSDVAKEYYTLFSQALESTKQIDRAVAQLAEYEQLSPSSYGMLVQANRLNPVQPSSFEGAPGFAVDFMRSAREEIGLETDPKRPSFIQRSLEQFTQLAERYPVLRKMSNIAFAAQHKTEQNLNRLFGFLSMEVDASGKAVMDPKMTRTMTVAKSMPAREAFSKIARTQQEVKGLLARTSPEVREALKDLSPELQANVWQTFESVNLMNQAVSNERIVALKDTNGLIVSKLLQELEPTRPVEQTEQIGATLMNSLATGDMTPLIGAMKDVAPEVGQKVQTLAVALHDSWQRLKTTSEEQPWYFTERRYGQYAVTFKTKEGKTGRASADTQAQIDSIIAQEQRKGSTILNRLTPDDMRAPLSQYSETYKQAVIEAQNKSTAVLQDLLKDNPELLAKIEPLLEIEADASAEMAANDVRKLNPFRKLSAGREYVDMLDASMISNRATVTGLTRRYLRAKAALYTLDPALVAEPALQRLATQHVDNMLTPDSPLGQTITKANFFYYIVGNFANMMQEPFQQLSTVLPALQREGGGLIQSGKLLAKANLAIGKWWRSGKTGNAEYDAVLDRFKADRENPHGFLSEFDSDGMAAINAVRFSEGKTLMDKAAVLTKPIGQFVDLLKSAYLKVPEHNARVTVLAAYENARSKGMTADAAYQDAVRIYRYSNFAGGKANRAVGVYSGRDPFTKSAAQTLMSLQTYQTGYISMLSRLISQGFGKERLIGAQGAQARKAAVTMLGVQFALAGALGLPFAGQAVALLQQIFPNLELEKNLRLGLDSLLGSDSEMGGFLTNSITHGVTGEIVGMDVSSRFGLGNMFGMSSFGFDPANMLGPTGGIIRNAVMGIRDASQGNFLRAAEDVVPPQLKRIVAAYREGGEFRDNAGNLLFEGTATEKAFRLLGYTPTRERDIREQQRILRRGEEISKQEAAQFVGKLADRAETGDYAGVRDALLQRQREDYSFDARAGLRKVAELVEGRLNPTDLRNQGTARTADDRQRLLETYNNQGGTTEVQRLQQRSNLERLVGLPNAGRISPTELRVAQMMDHLSQRYPNITKDQVKALARQQVGRQLSQEQRQQLLPEGW